MSTPQENAIAMLEAEIEQLGKPEAGTSLWWMLRAKSLGLSLLRSLKAKGIDDPAMAELFRKDVRKRLASVADSPADPA